MESSLSAWSSPNSSYYSLFISVTVASADETAMAARVVVPVIWRKSEALWSRAAVSLFVPYDLQSTRPCRSANSAKILLAVDTSVNKETNTAQNDTLAPRVIERVCPSLISGSHKCRGVLSIINISIDDISKNLEYDGQSQLFTVNSSGTCHATIPDLHREKQYKSHILKLTEDMYCTASLSATMN